MHKGLALLGAAAFLAVALAGCSGSSGDEGFSVQAPSAAGGEYVFKASGSADNYTWDLGDHLTTKYGKEVRHTYDFANGVANVVLVTRTGDVRDEVRQPVTLGTGQNAVPTFILEGQRNWTVVGETLKFSAAKSTDPDSDPLRYTWSCVRTGDAVRQPTHSHPGFQGVPFATPPAGAVSSQNAVGELPPAKRTLSGDMCEALGPGGRPSLDDTIEGSFTNPGIYDIYLLASDPVHPTTSGKYHFVVTPEEERPAPLHSETFSATFQGGAGGTLSELEGESGQVWDRVIHTFSLPLSGFEGWVVAMPVDATPATSMAWTLKRGQVILASGEVDGTNTTIPATEIKQAGYALEVTCTGPGATYNINVGVVLDMDPFKVY